VRAGRAPRIALFADGGDWHRRALIRALKRHGAEVVATSLQACAFDTRVAGGLVIPGFEGALPDGALVRTMAAGSFEQVTLRLGLLHALRELGIPVWNDARAIERCVDKAATTFLLARAGIATPDTVTLEDPAAVAHVVEEFGGDVVVKPLFGAQGKGIRRIASAADLPAPDALAGVYYLQAFVPPAGPDYEDRRVLVSGGRVVAGMIRRSRSWLTNIHQGAEPLAAPPDGEADALALRAAAAVGADVAGVDIIRDRAGRALVLEVNSMPAWNGLQSVAEVDVADAIVADLLEAVRRRGDGGA
jgi:tetrahydromethanopterin:alpha-L-glutamate ligase